MMREMGCRNGLRIQTELSTAIAALLSGRAKGSRTPPGVRKGEVEDPKTKHGYNGESTAASGQPSGKVATSTLHRFVSTRKLKAKP